MSMTTNPNDRPIVQAIGITDENDRYQLLEIVGNGLTDREWQGICIGYLVGQTTEMTDTSLVFKFISIVEGEDPLYETKANDEQRYEYYAKLANGWSVYSSTTQIASAFARFVLSEILPLSKTYVGKHHKSGN